MSFAPMDSGETGTAGGGGLFSILNHNNNTSLNQVLATGNQAQILQIAQTYGGPVTYAISFFSNPANSKATDDAVSVYGLPGSYGGDGWRNQVGWCPAYAPINDLYFLALMFSRYPRPENAGGSCRTLAGFITALDQERVNADSKYAGDNEPCTHTSAINAINSIQGIYRSMYSGLTCDYVIQQQNQQNETAADQAIADHAAAMQLQAQMGQAGIAMNAAEAAAAIKRQNDAASAANVQNIAGTGNSGTNTYLTIGIIIAAMALVTGAILIFKKKNKAA